MPDKKAQERAIGEAFLRWHNPRHASRFEIRGWPDESCSVWDLDAVCASSERKMAIEVGQAELGDLLASGPRQRKWEQELNGEARKRSGLPRGLWLVSLSKPPPDGLNPRKGPGRRFINAVLDDLTAQFTPCRRREAQLPLPRASHVFPSLPGLTGRVALIAEEPRFRMALDWPWAPGWTGHAEELFKANVLEEARKKFACAPDGAMRVLLVWSIDHDAGMVADTDWGFLVREAPSHNLDAVYFVRWQQPIPPPTLRELLAVPASVRWCRANFRWPWWRAAWEGVRLLCILMAKSAVGLLPSRPTATVVALLEKEEEE